MKRQVMLALMVVVALVLSACSPTALPTPAQEPAATSAVAPVAPTSIVNAWGRTLPDDAAPLERQVWRSQDADGLQFS